MKENGIVMNEYLPLRDVVFHTLRESILKGELEPGERLMEIQLAEKLGVSRTPVREAIRKLELEGLAIVLPRRGAIVAQITVSDLKDVLEVRTALEELTIELACKRITTEELEQLKECFYEFQKAARGRDLTVIVEADVAFHDVIYKASRNHRLIQILNNLREQMYRYRLEYIKDEAKRLLLIEEHKGIVQAIENNDIPAAKGAIQRHIANQEKAIIETLEA